ncbi:MAG: long-chain fatty acid--CoA ligase [Acetobacteraceae bacterium]|nr:long-chain fatty acid--CoA ligase [Acetobacteraceae bacterium]
MFGLARTWPDRPMLRAHREDAWHGITWGVFARLAASAARRLRQAGVAAGDRVLITSENRPEYPIAETALMAIRAVPVPTYTTNTIADHAHILRDSGARAAIVSSPRLAQRITEAARERGGLDVLVVMDGGARAEAAGGLAWSDLVADDLPPDDIALEAAGIPPGTLACLIYTSGTGGAPKGVMLPHRSVLANCRGAFELLRPLRIHDDVYLSFLPLSHAYEHTAGQFFLLSLGAEVVYARGVEHIAADMRTVRPTIMTVVPRILEAIRGRILAQVAREKPWKRALFERAMAIGLRRLDGALTLGDRLLDPVLDLLVRRRVRARLGTRLRAVMSGGARLEPDVGRFFLAMGIKVMQGYGQTEAGPVISANPPEAIRIDTVGLLLPGVGVRIAEDGEILVRGELVMDGYWDQPEATRAVIRDGWLHTGDIGTLDPDGYLFITDRKRDMIVLSGGENVSPAKIEGMLMAEPEIAQAVVAGEGRSGLTALVVPEKGFDEVAVAVAVSRANLRLSVTERVRSHRIVGPFTVENGLLTPSHKIRRLLVMREYARTLAGLDARAPRRA